MYPGRMTVKNDNAAESGPRGRALIATGAIGAALAAICCLTPLLAFVLGAVGLTAWLAKADYIVIPVLILGIGLLALGLYRRRLRSQTRP
jgi:mercuric ion transport protein